MSHFVPIFSVARFFSAILLTLATTSSLASCAESGGTGDRPVRDAGRDADSLDLGTTPVDLGTTPVDFGTLPDAAVIDGGGVGALAINELRASGDDWIELMNTGTTTLDVSGLRIADLDEATSMPKLAEALSLPAGTTIAPGSYLVIVAGITAPRVGPQSDCLAATLPTCFEAGYGLSGSRGDRVFVVAATTDVVLLEAAYPGPTDPVTVPDGSTWSRLPNGTGVFAVGMPTPGAENAAMP